MKSLVTIKLIHTAIWVLFNIVLFYMIYAVIMNKITIWVWLGLASFAIEGLVLLAFGNMCPLTIMARKFSSSKKDNFDIYLPEWLARNNKVIYTSILLLFVILLTWRIMNHT